MKIKKLSTKITFLVVALVIALMVTTIVIVRVRTDDMISELTFNQSKTGNSAFLKKMDTMKGDSLIRADVIAASEPITRSLVSGNIEHLTESLSELSAGLDFAVICDKEGAVMASTYGEPAGAELARHKTVSAALMVGEKASAIGTGDAIRLMVSGAAPIKDSEGEIIGAVICGYDLTRNVYVDELKEEQGCEVTLLAGDERVNSTIVGDDGNRIIGTKSSFVVVQAVIGRQENFHGRLEIEGRTYETYYSPLTQDGEAVGMVFTGFDIEATLALEWTMMYWIVLAAVCGLLLAVVIIAVASRSMISVPLRKIGNAARVIENEDVSAELYDMAKLEVRSADEIGELTSTFNDMLDRLSHSTKSLDILANILDGMDAYIYVSDPLTDEVLFINYKMKEHFKLGDNVIGEVCWKLLQSGKDGKCEDCPKDRLMNGVDAVVVWEEHNTVTGRWYKNADSIIFWPGGRRVHLQHRTDITDMKEVEAALVEAKEAAESASSSKSEFLSRMSHEIRTPMNAVIGMTGIAKSAKEPEKIEHYLDTIDNASRHLLGIINDILDMSKIESGKLELNYAEFNFENMLGNMAAISGFLSKEKKQELIIDIDKNIPEFIISDEQRLGQVVANLLSNAVKFTPEGGRVLLNARLTGESEEECGIEIEVVDNGIGISEEAIGRLFNPFEQANGGIARKYGGTGLGLSISRSIIEKMGGNIRVESEPGQGSRFIFEIKARKGAGPESGGGGDDTRSGEAVRDLSGYTILLAEDAAVNREIMTTLLADTGAAIDCAEDGRQALGMFREKPEKYALVLMDLHMPEMDGYEATREIRALGTPEAARVPIIAMTADVFQEDIEKCLAAGMNDHIGKPLDLAELFGKLDKYMPD